MKKLIFIFCLFVAFNLFGQTPEAETKIRIPEPLSDLRINGEFRGVNLEHTYIFNGTTKATQIYRDGYAGIFTEIIEVYQEEEYFTTRKWSNNKNEELSWDVVLSYRFSDDGERLYIGRQIFRKVQN